MHTLIHTHTHTHIYIYIYTSWPLIMCSGFDFMDAKRSSEHYRELDNSVHSEGVVLIMPPSCIEEQSIPPGIVFARRCSPDLQVYFILLHTRIRRYIHALFKCILFQIGSFVQTVHVSLYTILSMLPLLHHIYFSFQ